MDNPDQQSPVQPSVEKPEQQASAPKVSRNPKIFFGIFIILALIASFVAGGFILGTKSNSDQTRPQVSATPTVSPILDPTANWKTYVNSQHGYSVKYPSNLKIDENTLNSAIFNIIQTSPGPSGFPTFYISVMPNPAGSVRDSNIYDSLSQPTLDKIFNLRVGEELDQVTARDLGGFWNINMQYKRLNDEIIDNNNFLVLENLKAYGGVTDKRLFLKMNDKIYMIGAYNFTNNFKLFYSTFKFTDQNQATVGSGPQTYINKKYGFQLTFPDDWKGYSVIENSWTSWTPNGQGTSSTENKNAGPLITFRDPRWTNEKRLQDIPIMVITPSAWALIVSEKMGVSAAPVPPAWLGQNQNFVFATPPRWYGFTTVVDNNQMQEAVDIAKTFKAL